MARQHDDVPQPQRARQRQQTRSRRRRCRGATSAASITRRRSKRSLIAPPSEQERDRRHGHRDADDRKRGRERSRARTPATPARPGRCRRRASETDMPAHSRRKSRCLQRREQADAAVAAGGAVERLVAMLHRPDANRCECSIRGGSSVSGRAWRYSTVLLESIGLAKKKPWPSSQPSARSADSAPGTRSPRRRLELERLAEADDRRGQARVHGEAPELRNERSILRMSTGKPAEVAERRVPGAEVVHRDLHAELLELVQRAPRRGRRRPSSPSR